MNQNDFLDWIMTSALAALVALGIVVLTVTVISALADWLGA